MLYAKKIRLNVSRYDANTLDFMQAKCRAMPLCNHAYTCPQCGPVMDRDENSARNILARFLARLGPYLAV